MKKDIQAQISVNALYISIYIPLCTFFREGETPEKHDGEFIFPDSVFVFFARSRQKWARFSGQLLIYVPIMKTKNVPKSGLVFEGSLLERIFVFFGPILFQNWVRNQTMIRRRIKKQINYYAQFRRKGRGSIPTERPRWFTFLTFSKIL